MMQQVLGASDVVMSIVLSSDDGQAQDKIGGGVHRARKAGDEGVNMLVGGVEPIDFGSIRWCVWSFRPSSPFARSPDLQVFCLFICINGNPSCGQCLCFLTYARKESLPSLRSYALSV